MPGMPEECQHVRNSDAFVSIIFGYVLCGKETSKRREEERGRGKCVKESCGKGAIWSQESNLMSQQF
jgi:hypothetical protein